MVDTPLAPCLETPIQEKQKRRGRKPKNQVENDDDDGSSTTTKQKRVRKLKKKDEVCDIYNTTVGEYIPCSSDDEHVILKLDVQETIQSHNPEPYNSVTNNFDTVINNVPKKKSCTEPEISENDKRVIDLLQDFEAKNKNNEWPQTTSIHCYWCCHNFSTIPFGLPIKYVHNKFNVVGCFCSLECALSYNNDSKESSDEIWERNNLIHLLAKNLMIDFIPVCAPPRLSLSIFGGHLTIEKFRKFCKTGKLININFPPMLTLRQQIEEINECDIRDLKYIPVDTDRIKKYTDALTLKRKNPVNTYANTLDHAMNLKFGTSH